MLKVFMIAKNERRRITGKEKDREREAEDEREIEECK